MNYFLILLLLLLLLLYIVSMNNYDSNDIPKVPIISNEQVDTTKQILYSDKLLPLVKPQDKYYWGMYLVITPNSESVEKGKLIMFSEPKDTCGEFEEKQFEKIEKKIIIWMFCNDSKDKHLVPKYKDTYYWTFCMCDQFDDDPANYFIDPMILQIGNRVDTKLLSVGGGVERLDSMYFMDDGQGVRGIGKYGSSSKDKLKEYVIYKLSFPIDIAKDVDGINKPYFLIAEKDNIYYYIDTIRLNLEK